VVVIVLVKKYLKINNVFLKKTTFLVLFSLIFVQFTNAQQLFIEAGASTSYFKDYVNSIGINTYVDGSTSKTFTPFAEIGFRHNLYDEKLYLNLSAGYQTFNINSNFTQSGYTSSIEYDLSYFALKANVAVNVVQYKKFVLLAHTGLSFDILSQGESRFGGIVRDVYKDANFDRTLLKWHKGASIEYEINKKTSIYFSYSTADSFKEENKDSTDGEKYKLHSNSFSIGFLIYLNGHQSRFKSCLLN
jgi:hypothetical protein